MLYLTYSRWRVENYVLIPSPVPVSTLLRGMLNVVSPACYIRKNDHMLSSLTKTPKTYASSGGQRGALCLLLFFSVLFFFLTVSLFFY